ncbi:MAG TPA: hypothetical protein VHY09_04845 [Candidatus Methylacidiphilales bacterium]|jgi:hypothetical protein|nr:hypothetical protein [Candidatus Methylacidiphilales bacterium]
MKTSVVSPFVAALVALVLASLSPVSGQTTAPKVKKIPFHGTLQSVDASAGTVTLTSKKEPAGRVFHMQSDTKITDGAGNPSTLASAVVGEAVGGSYSKDASGNMMLNSLRLGAKSGSETATKKTSAPAPAASTAATPPPAPAPAATAPTTASTTAAETATTSTKAKTQRFSGKVVSVDAGSDTLVVHGKADQTFTVTSATKITGAANLGAVATGAKVSGSYQKSTDGSTLTVTTLKVAK